MTTKQNKLKEIITPKWFNESEVLDQIQSEYKAWRQAVLNRRTKLQTDLKEYYVAATKKDKVNIHTIKTTMDTLMSVY